MIKPNMHISCILFLKININWGKYGVGMCIGEDNLLTGSKLG
jgi:hypothetical protein